LEDAEQKAPVRPDGDNALKHVRMVWSNFLVGVSCKTNWINPRSSIILRKIVIIALWDAKWNMRETSLTKGIRTGFAFGNTFVNLVMIVLLQVSV
ncbi:hypothetical protein ACFL02_06520, partial [Planctomycetota bacterium]